MSKINLRTTRSRCLSVISFFRVSLSDRALTTCHRRTCLQGRKSQRMGTRNDSAAHAAAEASLSRHDRSWEFLGQPGQKCTWSPDRQQPVRHGRQLVGNNAEEHMRQHARPAQQNQASTIPSHLMITTMPDRHMPTCQGLGHADARAWAPILRGVTVWTWSPAYWCQIMHATQRRYFSNLRQLTTLALVVFFYKSHEASRHFDTFRT